MSAKVIDALEWRSNRHRRQVREQSQRQRELQEAKRLTLDDILDRFDPWGGDHAA